MAYIGRQNLGGAYRQLDDISSGFDGSDTTHTMQVNSQNVTVGDVNQIILSLGGVIQKPGTDFTVSGSTLTFTTAPAANTNFFAMLLGSDNGGTVTPTDASVTVDKLAIAGGEVKLDADGDTSITADTDDQIDFKVGGVDEMTMSSSGIVINEGSNDRDFRVESNSNTHMLFVDGGNNLIGINDSSPSSYYYNDLVVNSGDEGGITIVDTSSGQSALAFADGTSGAARYAGRILYNHNNDSMNIGSAGNTPLAIEAGGQTNTTSSEHNNTAFEVKHTGDGSSSYPYGMAIRFSNANRDNNAEYFYYGIDSAGLKFVVYSDGDVKNHDGIFTSISSDERLKSNIVDANSQWDDIKAIKFRNFKKKDDIASKGLDNAQVNIGVIAQEAESVTPNLVRERDPMPEEIALNSEFGTLNEDGTVKEVKEQVKTFKDSILFWKCAKALQEAMAKIETLEADVKILKGE